MRIKYQVPIIGICGWKSSGKTTLCEGLIKEFSHRGLTVSSVKHTDHDFHLDTAETDSSRHRRAGTQETAIIGRTQWALFHTITEENDPCFEKILEKLSPVDLVIIEGYKTAPIQKIETRRSAQMEKTSIATKDPHVIAIAADHEIPNATMPVFPLNSIKNIADFIDEKIGPLKRRHNCILGR